MTEQRSKPSLSLSKNNKIHSIWHATKNERRHENDYEQSVGIRWASFLFSIISMGEFEIRIQIQKFRLPNPARLRTLYSENALLHAAALAATAAAAAAVNCTVISSTRFCCVTKRDSLYESSINFSIISCFQWNSFAHDKDSSNDECKCKE